MRPTLGFILEGGEHLHPFIEGNRAAILVSGHFANWEIIPTCLHSTGLDYAFIYRAANNPLTDEFIIKTRAAAMTRRQIPKGKRGGRKLVETLKKRDQPGHAGRPKAQ